MAKTEAVAPKFLRVGIAMNGRPQRHHFVVVRCAFVGVDHQVDRDVVS
jgi:hypothetical protein